jgi:hypothetical protein
MRIKYLLFLLSLLLNRNWTSVRRNLNQLAASQLELPRKRSGTGWTEITKKKKTLGSHNWTQTGKGTYIRALCQNSEGSVEIKQRPIKLEGRTIHRTLSPKRTPFQTEIDRPSHLWKVPRKGRISHTYPMWLWGHSSVKISSPGPVLRGTKWLLWRTHK